MSTAPIFAADVHLDPADQERLEASYRRGAYEALDLCLSVRNGCTSLSKARMLVRRASRLAADFRATTLSCRLPLVDWIESKLVERKEEVAP